MNVRWQFLQVLATAIAMIVIRAAGAVKKDEEELCRLWLAPSTLATPNNVKYGLYAGIDYEINDIIPDVELAIPYVDFFVDANKEQPYTKGILDYLESQMWTKDHSTAKYEGNFSTTPFMPGLGVLGNYHSLVSNADWLSAASFLRDRSDITKPGRPHPSRGAITDIYNVTMVATQKIPAGMEIHPNFGDLWDKGEPSPFRDTITRKEIADADKVLDRIIDFFDRFEAQMSDQLKEDMLDFMLDKILGAAGGTRAAVIRSLIPQNYKKIRQVKEAGGTFLYRNKDMIKKPKWFEKHGVCVDTMYPGKSTIPDAGRGAFASKPFKEGDRITLIPTLLLGQRDLMNMFEFMEVEAGPPPAPDQPAPTKWVHDPSKPRGQQIGVNYVFGHVESSFLFLPMSPMVHYINHKSTPNAKLQWSTHPIMLNDQATWDHSVQEVMNFRSNMVVFEIEAITKIKKGAEIFIDYGDEWAASWEAYRQFWEQHYKKITWPLRAEDVRVLFQTKPYPTAAEDDTKHILPPGILTACYVKNGNVPDGTPSQTEDGITISQWSGPLVYENFTGALLDVCELKQRREDGFGSYNYTVVTRVNENGEWIYTQVNDVPQSAVTVVDAPYMSDIHFPDAFRHFIEIPDEIFPQSWRDLRS